MCVARYLFRMGRAWSLNGGAKNKTTYQCFLALFLVLGPHRVHPQRDMLPLRPDLHEALPQFDLLLLCFSDALLERVEVVYCDCLQKNNVSLAFPLHL